MLTVGIHRKFVHQATNRAGHDAKVFGGLEEAIALLAALEDDRIQPAVGTRVFRLLYEFQAMLCTILGVAPGDLAVDFKEIR